MSFRGCGGTWKFPHKAEEGGSWGKHGFPHGSEPKASDAHASTAVAPIVASTPSRAAPTAARSFEETVEEHRELLAALQTRDPAIVLAQLERHIDVPAPPEAPRVKRA